MRHLPAPQNVADTYQYLTGIVTPRPIAWITTVSESGIVNLAPFSFFNVFGADPPIVVFSPTLKKMATRKTRSAIWKRPANSSSIPPSPGSRNW